MQAHDEAGEGAGRMDDSAAAAAEGGSSSGWGPPAPDGGPTITVAPEPAPPRDWSPANVPCLRGPCRHYHAVTHHFPAGNPAGTFADGYEPREFKPMCTAQPGVFLEMTSDSPVYECNRWDPLAPSEIAARNQRRADYFVRHPLHEPGADEEDALAEDCPYCPERTQGVQDNTTIRDGSICCVHCFEPVGHLIVSDGEVDELPDDEPTAPVVAKRRYGGYAETPRPQED